ncbi:unnamed protein product [Blepharisma stoltei]|uniref:Uncharacterized protein n=1 Tax=Blepharisma stoltei TaxID=1481888 RepID=A0AAU9KD47_9CILI|nr:unnamed protein product [Blepharisma stoltei]
MASIGNLPLQSSYICLGLSSWMCSYFKAMLSDTMPTNCKTFTCEIDLSDRNVSKYRIQYWMELEEPPTSSFTWKSQRRISSLSWGLNRPFWIVVRYELISRYSYVEGYFW